MTALALQDIGKSFSGVEVLHGVELHIERGETLALLGENGAGKSTLMRMVAGLESPDRGTISVGEHRAARLTPRESRDLGVRFVTQELTNADDLSVAENISLGRLDHRFGVVKWDDVRRRAERILAELDVGVDVHTPVGQLSLGERQAVEIGRAISDEAAILVLDEPTAALSDHEAERLFRMMSALKARGVAIIFISHRLDEVTRTADHIQVLRDGSTAMRATAADVDHHAIVTAMVGTYRSAARPQSRVTDTAGRPPALELDAAGDSQHFREVTVRVWPGEIVMLYGKLGSGAAEIIQAASGDRPLTTGSLRVDRAVLPRPTLRGAIRAGVGFVPADRKRDALFAGRAISENLSAPSWKRLAGVAGTITSGRERAVFTRWKDRLHVNAPGGPLLPIESLSGGNQQKIILGRWLERDVPVLALVEPTRGVDVGARQQIYDVLREMAGAGRAVLAATSDLDEVIQCADRALVVADGTIVAELPGNEISPERLTHLAAGK